MKRLLQLLTNWSKKSPNSPSPKVDIVKEEIDQYEEAFSSHSGSIARYCHCGKTFYSSHYSDRNYFDEGELERYEKDPNAFGVEYTPGGVYVMGIEYCNACDCWHEKAQKKVNYLLDSKDAIAAFYALEKKKHLAAAADTPVL